MDIDEAVEAVCDQMAELSDEQIAQIHHEASEEAYDRKLTTEQMVQLISD